MRHSSILVFSVSITALCIAWVLHQAVLNRSIYFPSGAQLSSDMVYEQFMLFGDSLFQHSSSQERGYTLAPALQAEYIRRLDVVNRGFSGYNTDQALDILPKIIPASRQAKIRFLVIFFGANDSCLKGAAGSQHVPLERYKQNLRNIIRHPVLQEHNPRIILVAPPPVNEYTAEENDRGKGYIYPRRKAEHTKLYADAAKDVAKELNVTSLDLWTAFMRHAGYDEKSGKLPGSKEIEQNAFLRMLLHDGELA